MNMPGFSAIPVEEEDFLRFQRFMLEQAGIHLGDSKRALLSGRLARRLRELGIASYGRYWDRVRSDDGERMRILDLLLTNKTSFFREPEQFGFVADTLIPAWLAEAEQGGRRRCLTIWSAGCSTGEEPFSLAMLLHDRMDDWRIEIVATDLSATALKAAQQGMWPITSAAAIPEGLLRRYMLRGVGDRAGMVKATPEIRSMVTFRRVNLHDPAQIPAGPFDLVMCRNVLIYFESRARRQAVERLVDTCAVGGYFFVGHAETLQGYPQLKVVRPTVWRRV